MLAGLVADGTLGYDDKASKHLTWWDTDATNVPSLSRHFPTIRV